MYTQNDFNELLYILWLTNNLLVWVRQEAAEAVPFKDTTVMRLAKTEARVVRRKVNKILSKGCQTCSELKWQRSSL